ncbi:MAG: hypothetical protein RID91_06820 [Azospirillaceae bacterium]
MSRLKNRSPEGETLAREAPNRKPPASRKAHRAAASRDDVRSLSRPAAEMLAHLETKLAALSEEEATRLLARWPEIVARIDRLAETAPERAGRGTGRRPTLDDARRRAREVIPAILSGPDMLSSQQVGEILGISVQAVNERRRKGKLFALTTTGWSYRYPDWQFAYREAVPGLDRALAILDENGYSRWRIHRFMTTPQSGLDGCTGIECIRAGDLEVLERLAIGVGRGDFG